MHVADAALHSDAEENSLLLKVFAAIMFMTCCMATCLLGFYSQPAEYSSRLSQIASAALANLSIDLAFTFSWPTLLPLWPQMQLLVSVLLLVLQYGGAVFVHLAPLAARGAVQALNGVWVSPATVFVNSSLFGVPHVLTSAQQASVMVDSLRHK